MYRVQRVFIPSTKDTAVNSAPIIDTVYESDSVIDAFRVYCESAREVIGSIIKTPGKYYYRFEADDKGV